MKKLVVLTLFSVWFISCNKKEDKSLINSWDINSLVEDFNSVLINFNGSMILIFKEDYTIEF